jgi:FkbM family methyltransferase
MTSIEMKLIRKLLRVPIFLTIAHCLVSVQNRFTLFMVAGNQANLPSKTKYSRFGTIYGGWWIPTSLMGDTKTRRLLISAGLGFDVSFDYALAREGFELVLLDPLPESVKYAEFALKSFESVTYINKGVSSKTGKEVFYPPMNLDHDSWSLVKLQDGDESCEQIFPTIGIENLLVEFGFESAFTILKMDIEGGEVQVLETLLTMSKNVDFLAVEMDFLSLIPFFSIVRRVKAILYAKQLLTKLGAKKYEFVGCDNFNFYWDGNQM